MRRWLNAALVVFALWESLRMVVEFQSVQPLMLWVLAAGGGYFLRDSLKDRP